MKIDFEKVLAEYGLKVGDKIKFNSDDKAYEIKKNNDIIFLYNECGVVEYTGEALYLKYWEKVEPKKKVGDLNCDEIKACSKCPLNGIECGYSSVRTIRSQLEETLEEYPNLEPMREYIEKELNKEVVENDSK